MQILVAAVMAGIGTLAIGFLVLGILPTIERLFDITTGMTLVELRDPKQPLLRQLQQRAPGTYNHSLQVANIAEAAAEAIGADGLLVYVGALYHDIGKMNKPEYFVENQSRRLNKHDKLSPAMSLLVIVGHVKDGIELARGVRPAAVDPALHRGAPRHDAGRVLLPRAQAGRGGGRRAGDARRARVPLPRPAPAEREAAILMVCDAVESAAPRWPSRRPPASRSSCARSRGALDDGQFDECALTFRELRPLEESIAKSLGSIYHGRVVYPSTAEAAGDGTPRSRTSTTSAMVRTEGSGRGRASRRRSGRPDVAAHAADVNAPMRGPPDARSGASAIASTPRAAFERGKSSRAVRETHRVTGRTCRTGRACPRQLPTDRSACSVVCASRTQPRRR